MSPERYYLVTVGKLCRAIPRRGAGILVSLEPVVDAGEQHGSLAENVGES